MKDEKCLFPPVFNLLKMDLEIAWETQKKKMLSLVMLNHQTFYFSCYGSQEIYEMLWRKSRLI